ncbi:hypothetical protein GBAR_LOCUS1994, partial [Geodia barretti]
MLYYQLFSYLEDNNILDVDNEIHLFCLHYVFLPRVNQSLQQFIQMWNNHPLGTERNMSPTQLWMTAEHPDDVELTLQDQSWYGLDWDGPFLHAGDSVVEVSPPLILSARSTYDELTRQ